MPNKETRDLMLLEKLKRVEKKEGKALKFEDRTFGDFVETEFEFRCAGIGVPYRVCFKNPDRYVGTVVAFESGKSRFFIFEEWGPTVYGDGTKWKPSKYAYMTWSGYYTEKSNQGVGICCKDWVRSALYSYVILNLSKEEDPERQISKYGVDPYKVCKDVEEHRRNVNERLIMY